MIASPLNDILLHSALTEDLGFPFHDATTDLLFPNDQRRQRATILSKHAEPITICGIDCIRAVFTKLSDNCEIHTDYRDGDRLAPGATLLTIEAPASALLKGERTALNFLRHLSAIATLTAKYVERVKHTQLKILDTRKTTPGLRQLEKYAVHCGGGINHRMGLFDAIMVKDTHIDLLGGMAQAINHLPERSTHHLEVIVEVRSRQELDIVLELGHSKVSRVLLDNMAPELLRECVAACQGVFTTEASGNINLSKIVTVAETGVNFASIGELTYNAGHVDLSMYTHTNFAT